ncbi:hypothetical protein FPRO06_09046 [Fusarium proliferatum]|nr:hypothetical protein FPRO06_09046 [Fusarium proliferatum]
MDTNTSIGIQAVLLVLALVVLILRCWANFLMKQALFSLPDIFAWLGWVFSLGWFICSTLALRILIDNPAIGSELVVNSVEYLKDPSDASIENQLKSAWNSYASFCVQWGLNFSTDLLIFFYPFFLLKHLKLHRKQKIALIGIFSLGAITLIVSLSRFIAYNATDFELDDQSGNTLSLAEMSTAVIVVCLPGLRRFIMRSKSSTNRSSSNQPSGYGVHTKITGRGQNAETPASQYAKWGVRDDEIELVTHIRVSHERLSPDDARSASGQSAVSKTYKV